MLASNGLYRIAEEIQQIQLYLGQIILQAAHFWKCHCNVHVDCRTHLLIKYFASVNIFLATPLATTLHRNISNSLKLPTVLWSIFKILP